MKISGNNLQRGVEVASLKRDKKWTFVPVAKVGDEVEALYTNWPAGGGGARKYIREIVSVASIFIPKDGVNIRVVSGDDVREEECR